MNNKFIKLRDKLIYYKRMSLKFVIIEFSLNESDSRKVIDH